MSSDEQRAPMSAARLNEIQTVFEQMFRQSERGSYGEKFYRTALEVLADNDRLRAELAATARLAGLMEGQRDEALEIVRAVASGWSIPDEIEAKARALLARSGGATGEGEGDAG